MHQCLSNNILYQVKCSMRTQRKFTAIFLKQCLNYGYPNHRKSLNHKNQKSDAGLSKEFLKIKGNNCNVNIITWKIWGRNQGYNTSSNRCLLCLNEKLKTALHRNNNLLYK